MVFARHGAIARCIASLAGLAGQAASCLRAQGSRRSFDGAEDSSHTGSQPPTHGRPRAARRTRSEAARAILTAALSAHDPEDPAVEAGRQPLLASRQASDAYAVEFIASAADLRGWR
jgi:hypothetical protein